VVRCSATKNVFGHVIPRKGADEEDFAANRVVKIIEWLGHSRLMLKSDNGPAVKALVRASLEIAKVEVKEIEQITSESPPAYDSQANGGTEVGVRVIRGLLRTLKLCLESRIDKHIPVGHPVVAWMLEHICPILTATVRGSDGRTPWARVRGKAFAQQMVGFGESVLYKYPTKGPKHAPHGNIGALGADGIFLGYNRSVNTFVIATKDGLATASF
jgi:hypothetical protein